MSGPHRRVFYMTALSTGLRRDELGSLTPESFRLDAQPPTVTVEGQWTKNRKTATLPLRQDVAAFWRSMDANAAAIRAADPDHSADVTSTWLAERVIGRDRDGNLLCPAGVLPLDARGH